MIDLNKLTLAEKIRLYADGDEKTGLPPHGFDFTREDTDKMLKALADQKKLHRLAENMSSIMELGENVKRGDRIE